MLVVATKKNTAPRAKARSAVRFTLRERCRDDTSTDYLARFRIIAS